MKLKPSQEKGIADLNAKIASGAKRLVFVLPTGGGKTFVSETMIRKYLNEGAKVAFYTHRRMLCFQTKQKFEAAGLECGLRISGEKPDYSKPLQIAMVQTESARAIQKQQRFLHDADVVFLDELHACRGAQSQTIMDRHVRADATFIGLTATPLDIWNMVDDMVVGAVNSDLRREGLHVPCETFAPDQPDMSAAVRNKYGDYSSNDISSKYPKDFLYGRVIPCWLKLNPERKPTVLFAPSVRGAITFTRELEKLGHSAASIDGENCFWKGKEYPSSQTARDEIMQASKEGDVKVICNRFVLREGIDAPWFAHCISATVWGGLTSYLQAGGRLLRAYPGLDKVIYQDHGGSCFIHGSLNEDRSWSVGNDSKTKIEERAERHRNGEPEPIRCPACFHFRMSGPECPNCGHRHSRSSRSVYQTDGSLKRIDGAFFKKRRKSADFQKSWDQLYYSSKNSRSPHPNNFKQLYARFHKANPEYRIVTKDGKTCVKDQSGEYHTLGRIPEPGSPYWGMPAKLVAPKNLQWVSYE